MADRRTAADLLRPATSLSKRPPGLQMDMRLQKRLKMDSSGADEFNLRFGINDIDFSDMVLRLEFLPLQNGTKSAPNPKTLRINSLLLAAKSPFFQKLFQYGMRESQQRNGVTVRINASEEAAFMDMLNSIYHKPLKATLKANSAPDLVKVLMVADKFEVPSCVSNCVDLLLKLPMSLETALLYLGLPSCVMEGEIVQPLIESAKCYIYAHYITMSQEELMELPLCAVELLIGSDGLQVDSEDLVFEFILKWGRLQHPELEERREILTRLLLNFVCLPKMSSLKLKEVIDCSDFDYEKVCKPVLDALLSKDQDYEYPKRVYTHRIAVQVVQLQLAHPKCLVYFDLKKKECADLILSKRIYSQTFWLGGQKISLFAHCAQEKRAIGLYVFVMGVSETCTLDFGFSVMKKSSEEFTRLFKVNNSVFRRKEARGNGNPFSTSWAEFMSNESEYFIDGILHLRADITLIS